MLVLTPNLQFTCILSSSESDSSSELEVSDSEWVGSLVATM